MLLVSGSYCPSVAQNCLEYHPEYVKSPSSPTVSDRCLRYEKPSRCIGSRTDMAFCMDRFEYPNRVGEKPRVLTSYLDAEKLCQAQDKRLCTEDEFNFACEGPESTPYATGYERDSSKCNYDREYRRPDLTRRMKKYDECPLDAHCKSELERLDQRHAIGSELECVSFAGIVDLNGNVNEWVTLPKQKAPNRSGLKGGWWGPVRDRCRPTVTFHKEEDYGYEAGFRCCADAKQADSEKSSKGR
jgi:formylglycine-generating enzyme required for sulfatase activity